MNEDSGRPLNFLNFFYIRQKTLNYLWFLPKKHKRVFQSRSSPLNCGISPVGLFGSPLWQASLVKATVTPQLPNKKPICWLPASWRRENMKHHDTEANTGSPTRCPYVSNTSSYSPYFGQETISKAKHIRLLHSLHWRSGEKHDKYDRACVPLLQEAYFYIILQFVIFSAAGYMSIRTLIDFCQPCSTKRSSED